MLFHTYDIWQTTNRSIIRDSSFIDQVICPSLVAALLTKETWVNNVCQTHSLQCGEDRALVGPFSSTQHSISWMTSQDINSCAVTMVDITYSQRIESLWHYSTVYYSTFFKYFNDTPSKCTSRSVTTFLIVYEARGGGVIRAYHDWVDQG